MITEAGWFVDDLREALNRLYDSVFLRKSRLVKLFDLQSESDSAAALRCLLLEGIESLKPAQGIPQDSRNHEYYQVLLRRYVQGFIQRDVASQMGLSLRHLRRIQTFALELLAAFLWERVDLGVAGADAVAVPAEERLVESAALGQELGTLSSRADLQWTLLEPVMQAALSTIHPFAAGRQVQVKTWPIPEGLMVALPEMVLKQALLSLVTMSITEILCDAVDITVDLVDGQAHLTVLVSALNAEDARLACSEGEAVSVTRELVRPFGGVVSCDVADGVSRFTIELPMLLKKLVLAVEDNTDTLLLWARYLEGSPFTLMPVNDPAQALERARRVRPAVIILDVMMPEIDGWRLLTELREQADLSCTPIVICTVLPQEELALSIGASAFLRKPVKRQAFLEMIEAQTAVQARQ